MNLETMQTKCRKCLGDFEREFTNDEINAAMDEAHTHTVPQHIPAMTRDGAVLFDTIQGVDTYNLDAMANAGLLRKPAGGAFTGRVMAPRTGVRVDDLSEIRWYTDPAVFWYWNQRTDTAQSQPWAVLFLGRDLIFRAYPDKVYEVYLPASLTRESFLTAPQDGIPDLTEARAAIYGGALHIATEESYTDIIAEYAPHFEARLNELRGRALAQPSQRRPRRDF